MLALVRQTRCGFRLEGTPGTCETLAAINCVTPTYNSSITSNVEINEQPEQGTLSRELARKGARGGAATFETELYGSGTTADPYWFTHLLPSCGFAIAAHVATPDTDAAGTLTFGRYLGTGRTEGPLGRHGRIHAHQPASHRGAIPVELHGHLPDADEDRLPHPRSPWTAPYLRRAAACRSPSVGRRSRSLSS